MVKDPNLQQHLAHFGIHSASMKKTEKTMIEMEIDLNQKYDEWSIIQEDGAELHPLFGPGFTGLTNLGNSCYLNSVIQIIFSIPDFVEAYYRGGDKVQQFKESNHRDPAGDLTTQLLKLAAGLLSGEYSHYSQNMKEQVGIKPTMFKNLIGRNNLEFLSKKQQDAQEFLLYFIDQVEHLHSSVSHPCKLGHPPTDCFKFQIEERVECSESNKVKYNKRSEFLLSLPVSNITPINKEEYEAFKVKKEQVEKAGGKM